jgi:hypothetical protein
MFVRKTEVSFQKESAYTGKFLFLEVVGQKRDHSIKRGRREKFF